MRIRPFFLAGLLSFISFLFLYCPLPPAPPGPEQASIDLFIRTNQGISDLSIIDTVGNNDSIGLVLNLTQYIDSTIVYVMFGDSVEHRFKSTAKKLDVDTVLYVVSFPQAGDRLVTAIGYISGRPNSEATVSIHIVGKASTENQKPELKVPSSKVVIVGETMTFSVSTTDPDAGQTVTVDAVKKPLAATFANNILTWSPALEDTGNHSVVFIAQDNGTPVMSDMDSVLVTVSATPVNRAPEWLYEVIQYAGRPEAALTLTLNERCIDIDNDALIFSVVPGAPTGDTVIGTTWYFTPALSDTGIYNVQIIAADQDNATDTMTLELTIGVNVNIDDVTPPVLHLISPASNNQTVSSASYQVTVSCTDASGIAGVACTFGDIPIETMPSSDSLYTAMITGLQPSVTNTIRFIGTDNSPAANKCTLYVSLLYDPTAPDTDPPSITLISPSQDTVIGQSSIVVRARCTDESEIAHVTIGGVQATVEAGNIYTATVTGLTAGVTRRISIVATDAAPTPHTDSITVAVKYDNDATGPTIAPVTPARDSVSTNSSSYTVTLECTDSSGVASVNGMAGTASYIGVRSSGNRWDIAVTDLTENTYTAIVFTATDSSLRANTNQKTLYIKYDPTMDDDIGPTIKQVSTSPKSGDIISMAQVTIIDTIYDPSEIGSVTWTLNDGAEQPMTKGDGKYSLTATFTSAGTYTIKVTAFDNSTNKNSNTQTIELTYVVAPEITVQPISRSICPGEETTVSITATGTPPLTYQWYEGNGAIGIAIASTYTFTPLATTTLTCIVSNDAAESATSNPCVVTVGDSVSLKIVASSANICPGGSITLTATPTGGSDHTFKWSTGATGAKLAVTTAGTYSCTATSSAGCTAEASTSITNTSVSTKPTIRVVGGSNSTSICPNSPVAIEIVSGTGSLGAGATWKWLNNGNATPTSNDGKTSITGYPSALTEYTVKAVGGPCGVEPVSDPVTVTVKNSPATPAGITSSPPSICPNVSTEITLSVINGTTGATYKWYENGSLIQTAASPINVTISSSKKYKVSQVGECGLESFQSAELAVNTNTPPTVSISPPGKVVADGTNTTFSATYSPSLNYQWYHGTVQLFNNADYSNVTTNTITVHASGTTAGSYKCKVTDKSTLCSNTSTDAQLDVFRISSQTSGTVSTSTTGKDNVKLTVMVTGGSGSYSYAWYQTTLGNDEALETMMPDGRLFLGTDSSTLQVALLGPGISTFFCVINDVTNFLEITSTPVNVDWE